MIVLLIMLILSGSCEAKDELAISKTWCAAHEGQAEVVLEDGARVDCVTDEYAIEFDYAPKWAESVGQSLYYALMTGKKPGVVLILTDLERQRRDITRLMKLAQKYGIKVWTVREKE
jgi:hypothetical protein